MKTMQTKVFVQKTSLALINILFITLYVRMQKQMLTSGRAYDDVTAGGGQ